MSFETKYRRLCLHKETEIAINCIIKGLGDLQRIDAINTFYYAPLLFLSTGYERLLKCILCFSVLDKDGIVSKVPFDARGTKGHNIVALLETLIGELLGRKYETKSQVIKEDMEFLVNSQELKDIIELLSDFSQGGRYHYLDFVLDGKSSSKDPEKTWETFENGIVKKNSELMEALMEGRINEIYEVVNQTLVKTLERFTVALSRVFAFGKFNEEMRMLTLQVYFFLMLEEGDLGKTDYRDQTWDSLKRTRRSKR